MVRRKVRCWFGQNCSLPFCPFQHDSKGWEPHQMGLRFGGQSTGCSSLRERLNCTVSSGGGAAAAPGVRAKGMGPKGMGPVVSRNDNFWRVLSKGRSKRSGKDKAQRPVTAAGHGEPVPPGLARLSPVGAATGASTLQKPFQKPFRKNFQAETQRTEAVPCLERKWPRKQGRSNANRSTGDRWFGVGRGEGQWRNSAPGRSGRQSHSASLGGS